MTFSMTRRSLLLALSLTVGCTRSTPDTPVVAVDPATPEAAASTDPVATTKPEAAGHESVESETSKVATTAVDPQVAAAPETVDLDIVTFDELQAIVAGHKGKVVVVDYWSTSCEPCVTEFPHLVALSRRYPTDQVVCISASLDYEGLKKFPVEKVREATLEFLQEQKASLKNVIFSEESLTILDDKLELPSIPVVDVYGVDGALQQRFDDSEGKRFSYEESINPLVEKLVAEHFPTPAS